LQQLHEIKGTHTFHSHVPETRKKIMQQTALTLVGGSKIRMPAFGAVG
jgi:hypothetical protein